MRRGRAGFAVVAALWSSPAYGADVPENYGGFVSVEGGGLRLNGGAFYFAGANSYSMLYSPAEAEEQMRIAQSLGLNAIRFWGFWDGDEPVLDADGNPVPGAPRGTDRWGRPVLQSEPRVYNEDGFRRFDYVIYLAHLYGMKLVVPLLNEWDEFGGLRQYMTWAGLDLPEEIRGCGDDGAEICFYRNEEAIKAERYRFFVECQSCKDVYFDYVHQVLNRVNVYTGVAYKDDPAIMIWEIMNEPRYGPWEGDPGATAIRDFVQESARFIKGIDGNHLVATGEEGFLFPEDTDNPAYDGYAWVAAAGEGSSFSLNSAVPEIDVATFHGWPFNWAMANEGYLDRVETFMPQWIEEHARIAEALGKPAYLGEFGWQILRRPGSDLSERDGLMEPAYSAVLDSNLSGVMYWHMTASHEPSEAVYEGALGERTVLDSAIYVDNIVPHDSEFRFDVYCPEDVSTCGIIEAASREMVARVERPDPPFTETCLPPRVVCGEACVLLDSHPRHCGACELACEQGESCEAGSCQGASDPVWDDNESPYDTLACGVDRRAPGRGTLLLVVALTVCRRRR